MPGRHSLVVPKNHSFCPGYRYGRSGPRHPVHPNRSAVDHTVAHGHPIAKRHTHAYDYSHSKAISNSQSAGDPHTGYTGDQKRIYDPA